MALPFAIAVEFPTRDDLRRPRFWALAGISVVMVAGVAMLASAYWSRSAVPPAADATLTITSNPPGALILIGGRERGRTPATLALPPGEGRVTLRLDGHADVTYTVRLATGQTTRLAGVLWRRTPDVRRVRPPLPGATIAGAHFLADGRLALSVALPQGDERQLWIVDRGGGARRIGPPQARLAIAPSPDGARVAYLARGAAAGVPTDFSGAGDGRPNEVWITDRDGERGERRYTLPPNTADERLVDLSWAPDGGHLLLVSQQRPQGGGLRTRLLRLDLGGGAGVAGEARELIDLPSEVVPDSYSWSPEGRHVAFLARAERRTTLSVLATDGKLFRSLADVGGEDGAASPFPPLAWTPAGGVVYAALGEGAGDTFGSTRPVVFYADDLGGRPPHRVAAAIGAPGAAAPRWRGDGLIVALTRPKANAPLLLRAFDPAAGDAGQELGALPQPAAPHGVRWDTAGGRALVAARGETLAIGGGDRLDLWLVSWASGAEEGDR